MRKMPLRGFAIVAGALVFGTAACDEDYGPSTADGDDAEGFEHVAKSQAGVIAADTSEASQVPWQIRDCALVNGQTAMQMPVPEDNPTTIWLKQAELGLTDAQLQSAYCENVKRTLDHFCAQLAKTFNEASGQSVTLHSCALNKPYVPITDGTGSGFPGANGDDCPSTSYLNPKNNVWYGKNCSTVGGSVKCSTTIRCAVN